MHESRKDFPALLDLRKLYQVVADEATAKYYQLRVIDESGEDYLYPGEHFGPVRSQPPRAARGKPHFCEIPTSALDGRVGLDPPAEIESCTRWVCRLLLFQLQLDCCFCFCFEFRLKLANGSPEVARKSGFRCPDSQNLPSARTSRLCSGSRLQPRWPRTAMQKSSGSSLELITAQSFCSVPAFRWTPGR